MASCQHGTGPTPSRSLGSSFLMPICTVLVHLRRCLDKTLRLTRHVKSSVESVLCFVRRTLMGWMCKLSRLPISDDTVDTRRYSTGASASRRQYPSRTARWKQVPFKTIRYETFVVTTLHSSGPRIETMYRTIEAWSAGMSTKIRTERLVKPVVRYLRLWSEIDAMRGIFGRQGRRLGSFASAV